MADRITELLLRQGDISAEQARRSGAVWGGIGNAVGETVAGAATAIGKHNEKKKAAHQMAVQDAAFMDLLGKSNGRPDLRSTVEIYGPERGPVIYKAYESLQSEKPDLGTVLAGFDASAPPMRQIGWPGARQKLLESGQIPETVPAEYDHDWYEKVASSWRKKGAEPIKLGKDDRLVDPSGKALVEPVPPEPKRHMVTTTGPDGRPVQRLATEEELAAGVPAYREPKAPSDEPLVAVIGEDGNPILVPRSQAVGKKPASNREQGRPVTSGDANRVSDLVNSLSDINTLTAGLSSNNSTGATAKIGAMLPNFVTEWTGAGADAKKKQAQIDRVKQVIGKALEEGVLRKEDESKYEKILPTISDPPELVESKLSGLWDAIVAKRQSLIEALSDAGYDTSKFETRPLPQRGAPGATNTPTKPKGANPYRKR